MQHAPRGGRGTCKHKTVKHVCLRSLKSKDKSETNLGDSGCRVVVFYEPLDQVHVATAHSSMEEGAAIL